MYDPASSPLSWLAMVQYPSPVGRRYHCWFVPPGAVHCCGCSPAAEEKALTSSTLPLPV
jgi:hypothetical protein